MLGKKKVNYSLQEKRTLVLTDQSGVTCPTLVNTQFLVIYNSQIALFFNKKQVGMIGP